MLAFVMLATRASARDRGESGGLPSLDHEPFVSPRVVQELVPWLSDRGEQVVAVDLAGSAGANRYFGTFEVAPTKGGHPWVVATGKAAPGERAPFFRYQLVGTTASGIHVLRVSYGTGGTGVFESLLLLRTERERALSFEKARHVLRLDRERTVLRRLGEIGLGDRYVGDVSLRGDDILIGHDESGMSSVAWKKDAVARIETATGDAPTPQAIAFAKGASGAVVEGGAARGEQRYYTLPARKGQALEVEVTATEDNAVLQIYEPGWRLGRDGDGVVDVAGRSLPGAGAGDDAKRWTGRLPRSGPYLLVVGATRGGAAFTLRVDVR